MSTVASWCVHACASRMITSTVAGFAVSLALIAAIGAQNAFVLKQGLRREHVFAVVVTCATADAMLITAGIAGLGGVVVGHPAAVTAIRWIGAAFLLCYAGLAVRRALRPAALTSAGGRPAALRSTLLTCLALTYLNPHVYLDTVLLLGAVAQQHQHRWLFGAGAVLASAAWFSALGVAAGRLAPLFARPGTWRVLDGTVGAVMAAIAGSLLLA